jgi:hypothetical protein
MYGLVLVSIYATENEAIAFGHPDQPVAYQKRGGEPTDITDEEAKEIVLRWKRENKHVDCFDSWVGLAVAAPQPVAVESGMFLN